MPKLLAPHAAAWRGRVFEPDGTVDAPDEAVAELAAHGFRAVEDTPAGDAPIESMSRKDLIAFVRAHDGGNPVTLSNDALREAARKIARRIES